MERLTVWLEEASGICGRIHGPADDNGSCWEFARQRIWKNQRATTNSFRVPVVFVILQNKSMQSDWPQLRWAVSYEPNRTCSRRRCRHSGRGQSWASCRGSRRRRPVPRHWVSADSAVPWRVQKSAASAAPSAVQPEKKETRMDKNVPQSNQPAISKYDKFRVNKKNFRLF